MGKLHKIMKRMIIGYSLGMIAILPIWFLHIWANIISLFLRYIIRYRKRMIRSNLQYAFPEKGSSELAVIEKNFYLHLSDCIVETIKLKHMPERELGKRLGVKNIAPVNQSFEEGQPVIILLGHMGNWEWLPHFTTLFPEGVSFGEIYHKLHDSEWNDFIHQIRNRWEKVTLIPQKSAVKTLLRWNQERVWGAAFIIDQRPNGRNMKNWFDFLGHPTPFSIGAQSIGLKTKGRFFYADVTRPKRGYYTVEFIEIATPEEKENSDNVMKEYVRLLEDNIRRQPEIWLWSHNRWKYKQPNNNNQNKQK